MIGLVRSKKSPFKAEIFLCTTTHKNFSLRGTDILRSFYRILLVTAVVHSFLLTSIPQHDKIRRRG
jgi:hypothetical protein